MRRHQAHVLRIMLTKHENDKGSGEFFSVDYQNKSKLSYLSLLPEIPYKANFMNGQNGVGRS